mgnify:CR=1 FL=1
MVNSLFDITGKKAIVTGGTRGLGKGMAEGLMESGAEVAIIGTSDKVYQVADEFKARGFVCYGVKADLSDRDQCNEAFNKCVELLGDLDILVPAHGIQRRHPSNEFPDKDWDDVINTNLNSVFWLSRAASNIFKAKGYGKIIMIASMCSWFGGKTVPAYSAAKGGVMQLCKAFSNDLLQCGGPAKRETDTMPQWAGSSWYFLRYMDPHNDKALASKEALDYWSPVDWYNGGMEHTTLHLLYSRFWHKFLYDIGVVPTKEPYQKRTSHGMILGEGGEKMSKSRGNVVNPNDIVDQYGADTMRLHIMFIGDFEKAVTWSNEAVKGSKRFLDRVWNLAESCTDDPAISDKNEAIIHKTIKKVTEDIDELKMNTAIASMMTMANEFAANGCTKGDMEQLLLLLSPFAPHIVEELWERLGFAAKYGKMCCQCDWPTYDEAKTVDTTVTMAVQVLGKLKGTVTVAKDSDQQTVVDAALQLDKVQRQMEGMQIVKVIHVPNKLVNLILKPKA